MFDKAKRLARSLCRETSGNTMMLFALGMPMFVGGAGLATDVAQWYQWESEMQYAADQAALAGAWSRVGGTTGTEYQTRAQQEIDANLQVVDFEGTPTITLEQWNTTGAANSVKVVLSASKTLPFSSMLTGEGTTISVVAQASFQKGRTFNACLIAVDPSTKGAITFGGNAYLVSNCGAAALSNNEEAITKNGNGTFNVGYLVAAGGIDDAFDGNADLQIFENQTGLVDPFADLVPPSGNGISRTYECTSNSTYTATTSTTTVIEDWTYTATSANGPWSGPTKSAVSSATQTGTEPADANTQKNGPQNPAQTSTSTQTGQVETVAGTTTTTCTGNGRNRTCTTSTSANTYKRVDRITSVTKSITKVTENKGDLQANTLPGTYADFRVACNTTMGKGVYVIDGGLFKVNAQDTVIGRGIMIVLKNGAGIEINGGSNLDLRAMTPEEMVQYGGMTNEQAIKLKDMLVFEDRDSNGYSGNSVNGNAHSVLEGTIYLPKSPIMFDGSFKIASPGRCLIITAKTIAIQGSAYMESFCGADVLTAGVSVGGGVTAVKLVA